jgi:hypothetical protein
MSTGRKPRQLNYRGEPRGFAKPKPKHGFARRVEAALGGRRRSTKSTSTTRR